MMSFFEMEEIYPKAVIMGAQMERIYALYSIMKGEVVCNK